MTSWRLSPTSKFSPNQSLLRTQEFNFSKKFLWKLPGITPNFKSISPVIIPVRVSKVSRIKKFFSLSPADIKEKVKNFERFEDTPSKMPQLAVKGTQKLCNKPYFRKTFLTRMLHKSTPQKVRKISAVDLEVIEAWRNSEDY